MVFYVDFYFLVFIDNDGNDMAVKQANHVQKASVSSENRRLPYKVWRNLWYWLLGVLFIVAGAALMVITVTVPLTVEQQLIFGSCVFVLALLLRSKAGTFLTLFMIWLAIIISSRYLYWRLTESVGFESVFSLDVALGIGMLLAELYAFVILILGYFQTAWPLSRKPVSLPDDVSQWPTVDVFITTYNEPLKVVKPTVVAAMNLNWPRDKLKVHILDDGNRDEFCDFAREVGAHYITRPDNKHAKAGNINHALKQTSGELVAIFDCDHIPTSSFLQTTAGWFVKDEKLAFLQTPHHFYSADPFEKNLDTFRSKPNEGEVFYSLIQKGNDLWNAAFFCGSSALMRRGPLEEVGGVAVETVTEDAHTALKLHRLGYNSAYLEMKESAGLATESFSAHVGQRIRWARGMAQIFRIDNPLLGAGLSWKQRFCYTNAMLHFFYGLPRIVFLTAPLAFMFLDAHIIQASAIVIAVYALPYLLVSLVVNSHIQGRHRYSFWGEVYETSMSWYVIIPTLMALISPKSGRFNVTAKGGLLENRFFDYKLAMPCIILFTLNGIGLFIGLGNIFLWGTSETGTVILNLGWITYNLIILGAAIAVTREKKQQRNFVRLASNVEAAIKLSGNKLVQCKVHNLSEGGAAINISDESLLTRGERVDLILKDTLSEMSVTVPAEVMRIGDNRVQFMFQEMSSAQMNVLMLMLYSREGNWNHWVTERSGDNPLREFFQVSKHAIRTVFFLLSPRTLFNGIRVIFRQLLGIKPATVTAVAIFSVACIFLFSLAYMPKADAQTAGSYDVTSTYSLEELGADKDIRIEPAYGRQNFPFSLRTDEVVVKAELSLKYSLSAADRENINLLKVLVNDEVVKTITPENEKIDQGSVDISLNPLMIGDHNTLSLELDHDSGEACFDPYESPSWAVISNQSVLTLEKKHLILPNELNQLPLPFFDDKDKNQLNLPFVFGQVPDNELLEASAIISSWMGGLASYRGAVFPAYFNHLPEKYGVVFITPQNLPVWLNGSEINGPTIELITHPENPRGKLLLVQGKNSTEVKLAAQALVSEGRNLAGNKVSVVGQSIPEKRQPYDAPAWLPTHRAVYLSELIDDEELREVSHNVREQKVSFRLPPDLFQWGSKSTPLNVLFQHTIVDEYLISGGSLRLNNVFVENISLYDHGVPKTDETGEPSEFVSAHQSFSMPLDQIYSQNELEFFLYDQPQKERMQNDHVCDENAIKSTRMKLDGTSTMDFSSFPHFTQLPDLAKFVNAGFPYSRYADLSRTAIVMPSRIEEAEVSLFLTLAGVMGRATGAVASHVSVISPSQVGDYKNYEFIVLGGVDNQPLIKRWSDSMPVNFVMPEKMLHQPSRWERFSSEWLNRDSYSQSQDAAERIIKSIKEKEMAVLTGFESPLKNGRSVVLLTASTPAGYAQLTHALVEPKAIALLQGDLAIIDGPSIASFKMADHYNSGEISWLMHARWYLSKHAYWLFALMICGAFALALCSYYLLNKQARDRTRK